MMGDGEMHGEVLAPTLEHCRSMRSDVGELTSWSAAVANASPASSKGLLDSGALQYAVPELVINSDAEVEPVPVVTSDVQEPTAAFRVVVMDAILVRNFSGSVPLLSQAFLSGSV